MLPVLKTCFFKNKKKNDKKKTWCYSRMIARQGVCVLSGIQELTKQPYFIKVFFTLSSRIQRKKKMLLHITYVIKERKSIELKSLYRLDMPHPILMPGKKKEKPSFTGLCNLIYPALFLFQHINLHYHACDWLVSFTFMHKMAGNFL